MPDAQGVLKAVYAPANPSLAISDRLKVTILNATGFPPQQNPSFKDENGIWGAVFDSATNTLRVSVV